MIPYIGCVSREDAALLRSLAECSRRILEFGAGASTQIFAAYAAGTVTTVEPDPMWIARTKRNLAALGIHRDVDFRLYDDFELDGDFDLIMVDGPDDLRSPFSLLTWPALRLGGMMLFHDTRRTKPHGPSSTSDVQNVLALVERFSPEVDRIMVNAGNSNTTVVMKRAEGPLPYVDWQKSEARTDAQMGIA